MTNLLEVCNPQTYTFLNSQMEMENALLAAEMDKARWEEELRDAESKLARVRAAQLQIRSNPVTPVPL